MSSKLRIVIVLAAALLLATIFALVRTTESQAAATCTRWDTLDFGQRYSVSHSGRARCFNVSVPTGSSYVTVRFRSRVGTYRLYWDKGFNRTQISQALPLTFGTNSPDQPFGTPLYPAVTQYTLIVEPLSTAPASVGFLITVDNDGSQPREEDSTDAGTGGLTNSFVRGPGIRVGGQVGSRAVFTFEATCSGTITVSSGWDSKSNAMRTELYNPAGQRVASKTGEPADLRYRVQPGDLVGGTWWYVAVINRSGRSAVAYATIDHPKATCATPAPTRRPTHTPTPTRIPTRTPTPTRPTSSSDTARARVIVDAANLRRGPGTNYGLAGTATRGQTLPIYESRGSGSGRWYRVNSANGPWIWSNLVEVTSSASGNIVTVAFQNGRLPDGNYSGMTDAVLNQARPAARSGADLACLADGDDPDGLDKATLMRWDVGAIPRGSRVTAAVITLNVYDPSRQDVYYLYEIRRPWSEGQATWQDASGNARWSGAGASGSRDRNWTALGSVGAPDTGKITVPLNARGVELVQAWVDNPSSNNGIILANSDAGNGLDFDCSEVPNTANRPALVISYRP